MSSIDISVGRSLMRLARALAIALAAIACILVVAQAQAGEAAKPLWQDTGAGPFGGFSDLSFSGDGTRIAVARGGDFRNLDAASGHRLEPSPPTPTAPISESSAAYGTSLDRLAFGGGIPISGTLGLLWLSGTDPQSPYTVLTPPNRLGGVNAMTFSSDDRYLYVGLTGQPGQIHKLAVPENQWAPGYANMGDGTGVSALRFLTDRNLLASADYRGGVRLWAPSDLSPVGVLTNRLQGAVDLAFSAQRHLLAALFSDQALIVWSTTDWHVVARRRFEGINYGGGIDFSRGSRALLLSGVDGKVHGLSPDDLHTLYEMQIAAPATLDSSIQALRCSPTRDVVAIIAQDGVLKAFPLPLRVTRTTISSPGQFRLEWQGGLGPYQVQRSATIDSPEWIDVGSPTELQEIDLAAQSSGFFRVLALNQ